MNVYIIDAGWREFEWDCDGVNYAPGEGVVQEGVIAKSLERAQEIFIRYLENELHIWRVKPSDLLVTHYGHYVGKQQYEGVLSVYGDADLWHKIRCQHWHSPECEFWDMFCGNNFPDEPPSKEWLEKLENIPF